MCKQLQKLKAQNIYQDELPLHTSTNHHVHTHPSKHQDDSAHSMQESSCHSCIEHDSFASDESYYDENEDFELACINQEQEKNKLFYKMTKKDHRDDNSLQVKEDAYKLTQIFAVSDLLNEKNI